MTVYLSLADVLDTAEVVLGRPAELRDLGLLDSAVHRPQASMFGADAYPDLPTKAAALLESLARNHPLIDGNKRLAWAATVVFLLDNGMSLLDVDQDEAYDFVIAVAEGKLELAEMAAWLVANAELLA
ncbi:type II toxin-antitoxin system death-on-curing family toxin [Jiangella anatolica]|uniref:Type II toxin-antitoxin system death-on-curing family toxin n=1 Tax=Jiangella anatolica TaxID=2670374 RepID=A0A2W2BXQ0_9ACTN|nr:type II toxin-antitoxin system death-on-curing family toxin [Jiangella anatolica]PZF85254.1 type II toxin-antitoxin system death-on-curing family toxin [Jiangella anatolica]